MDSKTKSGKDVVDSRICACSIEMINTANNTEVTPNFDYLTSLGEWWLIAHDNEIKEDGTPKHKHYHLVLRKAKRQRKSSFITDVCNAFGIPQENKCMVQCDVILTKYLRDRLRYLCHLDNPEKQSYDVYQVKSNNKQLFMQACENTMTTDAIFDALRECATKTDAVRSLGIDIYCRYHSAIDVIFQEGQIWREKE